MNSKIQAISFDVGGTLIEPWPSVGHVYGKVAARHGDKASPDLLNRNFAAAWKAKQDFQHTKSDWAQLVEATFTGVGSQPPTSEFFEELYEAFAKPEAWRVFDDVLPALETLRKRGLHFAIVSNWDERLRTLLPALKLEKFFEVIVVSCEAGAPKPSPIMFKTVVTQLKLAPEAILHVGDSWAEDVEGAERAGLKAAWLARGKALTPSGPNVISTLARLPDFL